MRQILQWVEAPVRTEWGAGMMVASVALDKDATLDLYCHADYVAAAEAALSMVANARLMASALDLRGALRAIRDHWREFGPEHGFDEALEMACLSLITSTPE